MPIRKSQRSIVLVFVLSLIFLVGIHWTGRSAPTLQEALFDSGTPNFAYFSQGHDPGDMSPEEQEAMVKEAMTNLWRYQSAPDAPRPEPVSVNNQNGLLIYVNEAGHLAKAFPNGVGADVITTEVENVDSPQWSTDEKKIAFVGDKQDGEGRCLYTLQYNNKKLTTVNCTPYRIYDPHWSPGDQFLTFYGRLAADDSKMHGWVVQAAGGKLKEIGSSLMNVWTPKWMDEDTVVFSGEAPADVWTIYRADLQNPDQLTPITPGFSCDCTSDSVVAADPVLSPDKKWVAFVGARTESGKSDTKAIAAVYIVDPQGERDPIKLGDIADTSSGRGYYQRLYWAPSNQQLGVIASGSDQMLRLNLLRTNSDEVFTLRSREGGAWSNWDWSPDGLLIGAGHQRPDGPWEVNTVFVGSDAFQRLLPGHSPNWRKAVATQCDDADAGRRPVMLVTGWGGSERNQLYNDEHLHYFLDYFDKNGYVEGCNLFYALGTTPYRDLEANSYIIYDNLCSAYNNVKNFLPDWTGTFDMIGYSYGGLRARAFLENEDIYDGRFGASCPGNTSVYVENLITLGTPHGGEPYPTNTMQDVLPFAGYIGLCAAAPSLCEWNGEWQPPQLPALIEMLPAVRAVQNVWNNQPEGTCYYLIAGDARPQLPKVPPKMLTLFAGWSLIGDGAVVEANDFAVHRASSYVLDSPLLTWNYPRVNPVNTPDVHGQVPEENFGPHDLRSYVNPSTTFQEEIYPLIGKDCPANNAQQKAADGRAVDQLKTQLQTTLTASAPPHQDIRSGVLNPDEPQSGQFELYEEGASHVTLFLDHGDINFVLRDPSGATIPQDENYIAFDTGYGLMVDYYLPQTLPGTWNYELTVTDVEYPIAYRLLYQAGRPIAINLTAPQWHLSGDPLQISATILHNGTPLAGGNVTARIERPDGSQEEIALFDDGTHNDGAAGDGQYANSYPSTGLGGFYGLVVTASGELDSIPYERTASAVISIAPSARLTGVYKDEPLDFDQDSFYEFLAFDAQVEVEQAGLYGLQAELWSQGRFITQAEGAAELDPGTHELRIYFRGNDIRDGGLNGPYAIRNLIFTDQSDAPILVDSLDQVHQTDGYNHRRFGITRKVYAPLVRRAD